MENAAANEKDFVVRDCVILQKVIKESLIVSGYAVYDCALEVSRGFDRAWIVELRFEIER